MSDEIGKKFTLEEYVFRDLRYGNSFPRFAKESEKYELMKRLVRIKDPVDNVVFYSDTIKKNRSTYSYDVERWESALKTYDKYPCFFKNKKYVRDDKTSFYYFEDNGVRVKITADVLTGTGEIINSAKNLYKKASAERKYTILKSALNDFCSVAYTVGNCCPVMFNPLPRSLGIDADTCWLKLQKFIDPNQDYCPIDKHTWDASLNKRGKGKETKDNMFGIFSESISGKEIIEQLMLNDYYDDDYNLIIKKTPQEYAKDGVDVYINFLRLVTTLIIKRGIRIYNALPDDMKKA